MDKKIKQKLEGISPELDSASWDQLAGRLDLADKNVWDERVKEHLETASGGAPIAWDVLSSKLDASEQLVFDRKVEEKLSGIDGGTPTAWSSLEEKWTAWQNVRKDFVALRVIEVLAILLLIFSLHQWGALWQESLMDGTVAQFEESQELMIKTGLLAAELNHEQENVEEVEKAPKKLAVQSNVLSDSKASLISSEKPTSNDEIKGIPVPVEVQEKLSSVDNLKYNKSIGSEETRTRSIGEEGSRTASTRSSTAALLSSTDLLPSHITGMHATRGEDISPFRKSWYLPEVDYNRSPIWLSLYTTLGYNQIARPAVDTFESAMYTQPYLGGGLRFSFENGRWHLSSGFEYHQTTVNSGRTLAHIDGSGAITFVTLNDAKINFFTLPILINYSLIQNKRHQMYALAGARLHISSGINYNFSFDYGPGSTGTEPIDEMAIHGVSDVNFTYFTINAGLGYQRMINDRFGLFGSVGVELFGQNNSLFPNGEKINVLRFDTGLRIRL